MKSFYPRILKLVNTANIVEIGPRQTIYNLQPVKIGTMLETVLETVLETILEITLEMEAAAVVAMDFFVWIVHKGISTHTLQEAIQSTHRIRPIRKFHPIQHHPISMRCLNLVIPIWHLQKYRLHIQM